jgi:xanthine dehydrogenase small subunit
VGRTWTAETFERAADRLAAEFTPIDDLRASASYRRTVLGNLLRRLWHDVAANGRHAVRVDSLAA